MAGEMTAPAAAADTSEADTSSQQLLRESDFSTSSVDRFLREHGFDIDDHAGLELSSLSDDEDDEERGVRHGDSTERNALRIDTSAGAGEASADNVAAPAQSASATATAARSANRDDHYAQSNGEGNEDDALSLSGRTIGDRASGSSAHRSLLDGGQSASEEEEPVTPRFTLLHENDLLLVEGASRSSASAPIEELPELEVSRDGSDRAQRTPLTQVETDADPYRRDSLDRSMVLGAGSGSGFSGFSSDATDERSRIAQTLHDEAQAVQASLLQPPPSIVRHTRARPPVSSTNSALSSPESAGESFTSGSRRVQDDELSDALGVTVSTPERDGSSWTSTSRTSELRRFGSNTAAAAPGTQANARTRASARTLFASDRQEEHKESERLSFAHPPAVPRSRSASVPSVARSSGARAQDATGDSSSWSDLNDKLRQHGLQTIALETVDAQTLRTHGATTVTLPQRESLLNLVQDVVLQLERKDQIIQDIILESNRNSREQSRAEGDLASVEKKNEAIQSALERAKADVARLQAQLRQSRVDADAQAKALKQSCVRLQQQLKVSEHRVKAKEVLVERMQLKLQQHVDRESLSKSRDRLVARELTQRDGKKPSAHALERIGASEAQREELEDEVATLKTQVAALNAELRDKENYIARRAVAAAATSTQRALATWDADDDSSDGAAARRQRPSLSSTVSDDMMLERLEAARREQEQAASALRRREAAMLKKVSTIERELVHARETIAELKDENANLVLEAESRPSIRDYRLCQRRIHQLERQVSESKLALEEATDLHELRKYMGTKELMERDRLNHRLHLNRLHSLPRETALEVVKDVCRVLHLTDITLIAPSLEKLCRVVAAVPRMEKFIRDVCGFVFLHSHDERERADGDDRAAGFELEQVLPTLQQWTVERRKLHALESFQAAIVRELCKRSTEPSGGVLSSAPDAAGLGPSQPASLTRAVHVVSELIELEKSVLHHREIYTQAAAEIERRPSVLVNQIVRHFSHLFQVKSVDGVLPKINEIYLFVNEMENFLNVLRGLCHLKPRASVTVCLNAIRDKLERNERPQSPVPESSRESTAPNAHELPNFVVAKSRDATVSGVNGSHDIAGVRQVREMTILVRDLKRELGAASMQEILPRTKRLMELLSLSINNNNASFDEDDDSEDHGY